jgi:hypothetical protein
MVQGKLPESSEDWIRLWREHCRAAHALFSNRQHSQAWSHAGFAVECAIKAAIMVHLRLNRWPPKDFKPDYYIHDLAMLASYAGVDVRNLTKDPVFPRWCVVRQWQRGDAYDVIAMRKQVAADMLESACGEEGVIRWLMKRFRLDT